MVNFAKWLECYEDCTLEEFEEKESSDKAIIRGGYEYYMNKKLRCNGGTEG